MTTFDGLGSATGAEAKTTSQKNTAAHAGSNRTNWKTVKCMVGTGRTAGALLHGERGGRSLVGETRTFQRRDDDPDSTLIGGIGAGGEHEKRADE
jgi:hypothetical protein